ncbi:MAG: type I-C CRISPR-associated protein Cas5 [Deltaproteobacteria bacterium]|nr:MAG: type I-C CRISPR-associated protein Cas5 [Deltaproteobacteria bacterium]
MQLEKNRVQLRVWGEYACFTRPEMKVERVSYDVMTPSAARGILEAIYWKPQIRWVVDRIHVLNPIRFTNIRRNEVASKAVRPPKALLAGGTGTVSRRAVEEDRQQRVTTLLCNVHYLIAAHFVVLDPSDSAPKHYEIFKRRAQRGQCFHRPYLGCREFVADFAWHEGDAPTADTALVGGQELGWMLHDIDFVPDKKGPIVESNQGRKVRAEPRFFRASMRDGVIEVPSLGAEEIRS